MLSEIAPQLLKQGGGGQGDISKGPSLSHSTATPVHRLPTIEVPYLGDVSIGKHNLLLNYGQRYSSYSVYANDS